MEIAIFVVLGVVLVIIVASYFTQTTMTSTTKNRTLRALRDEMRAVASYFTQTIIPKIDIDTPQDPALELKAEVFVSEKLSPKKTPRPRKKK